MHHSESDDREEIRRLMKAMGEPLGATGRHPQGKLTKTDEGEIRLAIAETADGKVVLDFGTKVVWIGFDAEQALALADSLAAKARSVLLKKRETDGKKKTVCVDLDGVLSTYDGWKGADHFGSPRPGARAFMTKLKTFARVVVYTTRTKADLSDRPPGTTPESLTESVRGWLDRNEIPYDDVYTGQGKPLYAALVDDRAVAIRSNPEEADFAAALDAARLLCG